MLIRIKYFVHENIKSENIKIFLFPYPFDIESTIDMIIIFSLQRKDHEAD